MSFSKVRRHTRLPPHPILRQVRRVQATMKYATAMPSAAQLRLPQAQVRRRFIASCTDASA